jgi:acetyl-CoA C-acetyltransferase/acetyl-CoA acyltransferase
MMYILFSWVKEWRCNLPELLEKSRRPVLCMGIRSPFVKAGSVLREVMPEDLGSSVVNDLLSAHPAVIPQIHEVVFGCVGQSSMAPNVARVLELKTDIPRKIPAYTISRNCASGLDAVVQAMNQIRVGEAQLILAGGVESMSSYPLRFPLSIKDKLEPAARAKNVAEKLKHYAQIRMKDLAPVNTVVEGLTDPIVDMIMGATAEVLAKELDISRDAQDRFAQSSHEKATRAWESGFFAGEVRDVVNAATGKIADKDNGIRPDSSFEKLSKLKPIFERLGGTVTVGNASQVTDGAVALIIASEAKAEELGLPVLAHLRAYAFAGCDPERMGLGPVYATRTLFDKTGLSWKDIAVTEINEAFAAQVLACIKFSDKEAGTYGRIPLDTLNPNGGAIAMGHPVGASGARLVLTLARYLKKHQLKNGVATLCVGGGQGGAIWIESAG